MHDGRGEPQGEGCDGRNEPLDGLKYEPLDGLNYKPLEGLNYESLEELFKSHGRSVTRGFTVQRSSLSKSVACRSWEICGFERAESLGETVKGLRGEKSEGSGRYIWEYDGRNST